jgi:hypothetical protein
MRGEPDRDERAKALKQENECDYGYERNRN